MRSPPRLRAYSFLASGISSDKQPDLVAGVGPLAEHDLDELVEAEQPVRQPERAGPQHMRLVLEAAGVFVVRVDQQHSQVHLRSHDLAQDQRHAARFAGAGRAEDGEMLLHHLLDVDVGADGVVLLQMADVDRARPRHVENETQLALADADDRAVDLRIVRHAAGEAIAVRRAEDDFAQHVHAAGGRRAVRARLLRDFGEHADHERRAGADAEIGADAEVRGVAGVGQRVVREAHQRLRAADRDHPADGGVGPRLHAGGKRLFQTLELSLDGAGDGAHRSELRRNP